VKEAAAVMKISHFLKNVYFIRMKNDFSLQQMQAEVLFVIK